VARDPEDLKRWYREALRKRLDELRGLRADLRGGKPGAYDAARSVARALRGSGATFGFEELSVLAAHVESAPDRAVMRRAEGLVEYIHGLTDPESHPTGSVAAEWLTVAAGGKQLHRETFSGLGAAWREVAADAGIETAELARRVSELFGLAPAELSGATRAARRLVPEALIRERSVLPLAEDSETITLATADPTALDLELELARLTGRTPVFAIAPPAELSRAITALLDASAPTPEKHPRTPQPARPATPAEGPQRILIVDDDPGARLLTRTLLQKGSYAVEEAGDGLEALERLRVTEHVGLVVVDLNMPNMDGLELIWEMRAGESSDVPVIVVTGETDEVLEAKLIEEGADDYVRKPLDPRLFLARVAATMRRAEQ
jgi:CheY-like chemotaxis protein